MSFNNNVNNTAAATTTTGNDYILPFKPYHLRKTTNALDEIRFVTNDLQNLPSYFASLEYELSGRQRFTMYGQFDAPTDKKIIQKINGKNGFFLKKTIREADIDLIWWNEVTNHYLFWGTTKGRIIDAMNRLRSRIAMIVVHGGTHIKTAEKKSVSSAHIFRPINAAADAADHHNYREEDEKVQQRPSISLPHTPSPSPAPMELSLLPPPLIPFRERRQQNRNIGGKPIALFQTPSPAPVPNYSVKIHRQNGTNNADKDEEEEEEEDYAGYYYSQQLRCMHASNESQPIEFIGQDAQRFRRRMQHEEEKEEEEAEAEADEDIRYTTPLWN
jgi:hypothetical protein